MMSIVFPWVYVSEVSSRSKRSYISTGSRSTVLPQNVIFDGTCGEYTSENGVCAVDADGVEDIRAATAAAVKIFFKVIFIVLIAGRGVFRRSAAGVEIYDVYVTAALIVRTVGAAGFDYIIINTRRHKFSSVFSVPTLRWIGK